MLSRNRSMVRNRDPRDRTSTGIIFPPWIPVDGVESLSNGSATVATLRTIDATARRSTATNLARALATTRGVRSRTTRNQFERTLMACFTRQVANGQASESSSLVVDGASGA